MGFWGKIKQWFGIGGAKLELKCDPQVAKDSGQVKGQVIMTSKSDQHITKITIKMTEYYSTGSGENKRTKEFELGKLELPEEFDIKAAETKTFDFVVPFQLLKSSNDQLKEKGGVLGALGSASSFLSNEKSDYRVSASANVKGTAFSPSDMKHVKLT